MTATLLTRSAFPRSALPWAFAAAAMATVAAPARAQVPEGTPTEHVVRIPPGAHVDLDTGAVLPRPEVLQMQSDLHFDRDGTGFFAQCPHGGTTAPPGSVEPTGEWTDARLPVGNHRAGSRSLFLRTDRGAVARVTISLTDAYSSASAVLQWVLAPSANAVFLPGPDDLRATWRGGALELTWDGTAPRYLVEVASHGDRGAAAGSPQKLTVDGSPTRIAGLDPTGVHRVLVRGLWPDGRLSLPTEVTQHGPRRPASRGITEFPDRFYDGDAGISWPQGAVAGADAQVVFYLYGVYVPGGGVQKLGEGERLYRATSALPARGYLPAYGRLDEQDVLAVHLADGRYARLWLEATDGSDLRSGMKVHWTFLPDGRRHLLPAPTGIDSAPTGRGVEVGWQAVEGAVGYRVDVAGRDEPVVTKQPLALIRGLPARSVTRIAVTAVGRAGEESDAVEDYVHTFGDDYRVGYVTLRSQGDGIRFADAALVAAGWDLGVTATWGGNSAIQFEAPHGVVGTPGGFGVFDAAAELRGRSHKFDDRDTTGTACFLLRTGDGGLVSVRVDRRAPDIVLHYVHRLAADRDR